MSHRAKLTVLAYLEKHFNQINRRFDASELDITTHSGYKYVKDNSSNKWRVIRRYHPEDFESLESGLMPSGNPDSPSSWSVIMGIQDQYRNIDKHVMTNAPLFSESGLDGSTELELLFYEYESTIREELIFSLNEFSQGVRKSIISSGNVSKKLCENLKDDQRELSDNVDKQAALYSKKIRLINFMLIFNLMILSVLAISVVQIL